MFGRRSAFVSIIPMDKSLLSDPIPGLIGRLAWPASVGFFFHTMFNVVDTVYAGRLAVEALAALSLSFPVFFVIIALGSGLSSGTTALIATALGAGDQAGARRYAIQGMAFGVLVGLGLTALGLGLAPTLFRVLGAEGGYLVTCLAYMNVIFACSVLFLLLYMFNAILNALGDTRSLRNFLIVGFFSNLVLDPWFIYGGLFMPACGVSGVALSTVIIELAGCVYLGWRVSRSELICERCVEELIPRAGPFREIAAQGLPSAMNMMTVGLGIFIITWFAARFGQAPVAAYGAAVRVEQIVLLPTIGLSTATVTIVAQNRGAGQVERIFSCLRSAQLYGCAAMAPGAVLLLVLAGWFMRLFTGDAEVAAIGAWYLRLMAFLLPAYVILFVNVSALQGMKRPGFGLIIGLLRQIVLPSALFPLLAFACGVRGVWIAIFVINWSSALATFVIARRLVRREGAQTSAGV